MPDLNDFIARNTMPTRTLDDFAQDHFQQSGNTDIIPGDVMGGVAMPQGFLGNIGADVQRKLGQWREGAKAGGAEVQNALKQMPPGRGPGSLDDFLAGAKAPAGDGRMRGAGDGAGQESTGKRDGGGYDRGSSKAGLLSGKLYASAGMSDIDPHLNSSYRDPHNPPNMSLKDDFSARIRDQVASQPNGYAKFLDLLGERESTSNYKAKNELWLSW